jgi:hypothetical protein
MRLVPTPGAPVVVVVDGYGEPAVWGLPSSSGALVVGLPVDVSESVVSLPAGRYDPASDFALSKWGWAIA